MTDPEKKIEIIDERMKSFGHLRLFEVDLKYTKFDGSTSKTLTREVIRRNDGVVVIPFDPKLDLVVVVEQFRLGAFYNKTDAWLTEAVAGLIDPGESPENAAIRETYEETGLQVKHLLPISGFLPCPSFVSEYVYFYCAIVDASAGEGNYGLADDEEDIKTSFLRWDEFDSQFAKGLFQDFKLQLGAYWLRENRIELLKGNYNHR